MSRGKSLVESDIPGASLEGRGPENLKVKELQQWLLCRGASIKGKKADLIARLVQLWQLLGAYEPLCRGGSRWYS